jgi:UDP-N-acetylglucosamine--N-acetylmuramyl-(pentapeptide) pyrophosphoryl-undecaprenol N-acetylglucosamine transferase
MKGPIVLSAGGTGGHLFPAQALAGELRRRGHGIVVMTDARFANYATSFPGSRIETVPSAPLNSVLAPLKIAAGILLALGKLLRLRPAAVIGFGGYPSVPVMLAAAIARLPTAIIEQNAVVGRANRLVMNHVRRVAAAFPIARFAPRDRSKIVLTGNPLRPEVIALWGAAYDAPSADGTLHLLVFGGSQGARALSEIVPAAIARLPDTLKSRLSIVQQCRPEDMEKVRAVYAQTNVRAELKPFFHDMPQRMAEAHLVIGRAGAGTVAELMAIGRPAILVPLPHALDDNQTPNAEILSNAGAGWTVAQRDLTADGLAKMLAEILSAPSDLAARAGHAHALATPGAAEKLADMVEQLSAMPERSAA